MRIAVLAAWALLALAWCGGVAAAQAADTFPPADQAELQYQQAVEIRDRRDASQRELKHSVKLLFSAAGIQHLSVERPQRAGGATRDGSSGGVKHKAAAGSSGSNNGGSSSGSSSGSSGAGPEFLGASAVKLVLRQDRPPHMGALKELVFAYREGAGVAVNPAIAHRLLQLLAEMGHAESQADVAFHLALGIEPVAPNPRDQLFRLLAPDVPGALIHYTLAAQAGDPVAQMSLGYRHMQGLGVPKSCQTAALYYAPVAEKVLEMAQQQDGLPALSAIKLSYKTAHTKRLSSEQESLHYQWFADFGNVDAAREAARLLAHGASRDYEAAARYLNQAAAAGDSTAMAHLGHMYANGEGVPQDNATAIAWFGKAVEHGHPSGFLALGYMHLSGGHGLPRDYGQALRYLKDAVAAGQAMGGGGRAWSGLGDAYFYLGQMHLRGWGTKPDKDQAVKLWEAATRLLDPRTSFDAASSPKSGALLASYNLAMLHMGGHTKDRAPCATAVGLLKKVAEKGWPAQQEANEDFQAGDYEWALLNYLKAAEMGSAVGQSNAAWMLTEGYGYEGPEAGSAALLLWKRAAQQGDHAALLAIGDSYWYGKGVGRDWRRAAQMYDAASKAGGPSQGQAMFNLGFMHQYGAGLPKDHHLAKRCYDSASKARDAQYAVRLALAFLRLHGWWEGVGPRLPHRLASAVNGLLFTLREPSARHAAAAAAPPPERHPSLQPGRRGLWSRLRRVLTLDFLFDQLDELFEKGDNVDLTVAAGLLLMLGLVLWRRRMLRHQHQARQFVQAAPAAAWAAVPPQQRPPAAAAAPAEAPAARPTEPPAAAASGSGAAGSSSSGGTPAGQNGIQPPQQEPQPEQWDGAT